MPAKHERKALPAEIAATPYGSKERFEYSMRTDVNHGYGWTDEQKRQFSEELAKWRLLPEPRPSLRNILARILS